jgi:ArsR family transcriptional regulator
VLGEANRLRLIQALHGGERCVTDLTEATGLNQANASRHLQTLTDAGVLRRRKDGLRVLYSIADPGIFTLCDHVCGSVQERVESHARAFKQ